MQWTVDMTAGRQKRYSPEGELVDLGAVTLFQGKFSTPTGWLQGWLHKPLLGIYVVTTNLLSVGLIIH